MSDVKTGGCACGSVRFSATVTDRGVGACHCETCRKWTGGPFLAIQATGLAVESGELLAWRSSDWGERVSCASCGGKLWFRPLSAPEGVAIVAAGAFDDLDGSTLAVEIFSDAKPDAYPFLSPDSHKMTRAETLAQFAPDA